MGPRRPLVAFVCAFAVLYGLLIAPWPGWPAAYARMFQALCRTFIAGADSQRIVEIRPAPSQASLDSEIVVSEPGRADSEGRMPAHILGLDSRGVGWIPTALICALILATPIPFRRRIGSLLAGLVAVNAYVLFTAWVFVWDDSLAARGDTLARRISGALTETFATQLGASIVVPVLLWILVTFRADDWVRITGSAGAKAGPTAGR